MLFLACSVCKIVYNIYSISYSIRLFNQSVTPKCNNNTYYNLQFKKHETFHTQWMPITIRARLDSPSSATNSTATDCTRTIHSPHDTSHLAPTVSCDIRFVRFTPRHRLPPTRPRRRSLARWQHALARRVPHGRSVAGFSRRKPTGRRFQRLAGSGLLMSGIRDAGRNLQKSAG
jgi:hypothetical protein